MIHSTLSLSSVSVRLALFTSLSPKQSSMASFNLCKLFYTLTIMFIRLHATGQKIHKGGPEAVIFNVNVDYQNSLEYATKLISEGKVLAVPTDTIYGFAADADNMTAVHRMYEIKGRPLSKPVAICVHDVAAISQWARVDHLPAELLNKLLPGPVSIILDRTPHLNSQLNPNDTKISVRVPKHKFLLALLAEHKRPLALTSANKSGEKGALKIKEFADLWSDVESVFSGGTLGTNPAGSTVVDLSKEGEFTIVREGAYMWETLPVLEQYGLKGEIPK